MTVRSLSTSHICPVCFVRAIRIPQGLPLWEASSRLANSSALIRSEMDGILTFPSLVSISTAESAASRILSAALFSLMVYTFQKV